MEILVLLAENRSCLKSRDSFHLFTDNILNKLPVLCQIAELVSWGFLFWLMRVLILGSSWSVISQLFNFQVEIWLRYWVYSNCWAWCRCNLILDTCSLSLGTVRVLFLYWKQISDTSIYSKVSLGNFESKALKAKTLLEQQVSRCIFVLFHLLPYYYFRFACCQLGQE